MSLSPIEAAERVIETTYGDKVSVEVKGKFLNKFGRNNSVATSYETVQEFQGSEINETFVSTNLIDAVISSSASDTQTITVEGHTIDASGNLTFVIQDVTLTGQTSAALGTPLARATRAYIKPSGTFNSPQAAAVGNIAIYDNTDGDNGSGVPTTAAATKMLITAGNVQSEKAATAVSKDDYWIIRYFSAAIDDAAGPTTFIRLRMETRDVANGGVWRPMGREFVIFKTVGSVREEFDPPLIVAKNHDWRAVAKCDGGSSSVYAEAGGYLASRSNLT